MYAGVAELVDALASGASLLRKVEVQVLSPAPRRNLFRPNLKRRDQVASFLFGLVQFLLYLYQTALLGLIKNS